MQNKSENIFALPIDAIRAIHYIKDDRQEENMETDFRAHVAKPGHDFRSCPECLGRLKAKGIETLITIRNVRRPERNIRESVLDLSARAGL